MAPPHKTSQSDQEYMKHNLLKSVIISVILLMGVSNAWADGGIGYKGVKFTKNDAVTGWYNIHNVSWDYVDPSYECRSGQTGVTNFNNADLGVVTSLKLHSFVVIGWTNNDDWVSGQLKYRTYLQSATAGNYNVYNVGNYETTYCGVVDVLKSSGNNRVVGKNGDMNVTLVGNNTTPGQYYLQLQGMGRMRWCNNGNGYFNANDGSEVKASYTVPGFAKTTITQAFGSVGVGSNISINISFTNHYGTKLTTSNCVLSGTNKSEFSVTSISETGVTVKFAPTTAGNKSATLTIKDAHDKTCTITLNGKTQYTVTYSKGNNGTGNNQTDHKVYGTNLTLKDKGAFARTGYTQNAWNTNADGESGTSYALKATYTTEAAITLYPTWTANQYTITWNANGGSVTPTSSTYTYDGDLVALPIPTRTGYSFNGWFTASSGGTIISDIGETNKPASNKTYYAQWNANTYTVTFDQQGGSNGSTSTSAKSGVAMSAITPPTRDGYIFEGYYSEPNGQGKKYYNADGSSANLWDKENATLYAKWVEYAKCIFFKNNVGWNNVYIYTFRNNAWFNEDNGDNKRGVNPQVNKLEHGKMTKLNNESDIYYYILTQKDGFNHIAFSKEDMRGYTTFHQSKASYRSDRSDQMPLFIPENKVNQNVNETDYYNNGVWMKYNSTESGYRLNIMGEGGTFFTATEPGGYVFSATVHISTDSPYKLDITTLQNKKKFSNANYMTSNNCTEWTMDDWNWETESTWGINPTLVGEYTFTMNLAEGKVSVSATYPTLTETVGDYRLLYVEQVVEKSKEDGDEWKTIITRKKAHPSDIIKQSELASEGKIVSLHIYKDRKYSANAGGGNVYESFSNPEIILQQCTAVVNNKSQWKDVERHMVYGPLQTLPGMAMAPGRRNAAAEETTATLIYDDGIEIIKHDENNGNGVWNFTVKASGSTATIDLSKTERYPLTTGNYYIRTANAEGAWHNYKIDANRMTYSEYATNNNEFTHYFCKWIDINKYGSKNVQFVIANDYGQAISDTIVADRATLFGVALAEDERMVEDNGLLPASANVRFSWKEDNNALHRAYISGSGEGVDYLVLHDASGGTGHQLYTFADKTTKLTGNKITFSDNGGWMYQADIHSQTDAPVKLTALYNNKTQYFKGTETTTEPLIGGNNEDTEKYPIRVIYDFKENRLITGYVPQDSETEDVAIETNLMMIRKNHGAANQLTMNINNVGEDGVAVNTGYDAYGVLTFTEDHLKGTDNWKVTNDKTFYWISFPFDVNLKDAFGFGKYAYHWYIEYYDGASRAANGLFLDSGTYWEYVMEEDAHDFVLKANQGYVLWLNVAQIQADNFFTAITKEISIYFPSANKIANNFQTRSDETINLPPQRRPEGSRRYTQDSNWRLIGVPSYANTAATTEQSDITFVYVYDANTNKYNVAKSASQIGLFQSMHAYMVQYEGDINWTTVVNEYPSQLAAKQNSNGTKEQHVLRLELQRNGNKEDHTYIQLQDDKATEMFDMNLDLTKMSGSGGNIYSIIPSSSDPIQVAANVMPIEECIIPLGIKTTKATNYTFAMPEGTDGIVVELIDYETNTRTNMLLDEYTVNLGKGTFESRFALHVRPDKTVTSLDNIGDETTGDQVKKFLIDGVLYMQKDGMLYDAQGRCVQ